MLTLLFALACSSNAPEPGYDVDALCQASQTFAMPGVRELDLPQATGGDPAAPEDPSVILAATMVHTRSRLGSGSFDAETMSQLPDHLKALKDPKDAALPIAIDTAAPGDRVRTVLGELADAGYGRIALLTRGEAISVPPPPDPSLVASLRAEDLRLQREGSMLERLKHRGTILGHTAACPELRPRLESLLTAAWPTRCELLRDRPLPLDRCEEPQRSEAISAMHALMVPEEPHRLVTRVVDTRKAAMTDGATFGEMATELLGN